MTSTFEVAISQASSQIPTGLNEDERGVYKTLLRVRGLRTKPPPDVFVITDLAKDYDDLVAMVLLKELHRLGLIRYVVNLIFVFKKLASNLLSRLKGFVANLDPAKDRAAYGRGALDSLGLQDIPIAWGEDATIVPDKVAKYEFKYPFEPKDITFLQAKENPRNLREIQTGFDLLDQCVTEKWREEDTSQEKPQGLTFLLISSLTDIDAYTQKQPELFASKTARVLLQGAYMTERSVNKYTLKPDPVAANNGFDPKAASRFHKFIGDKKIPSVTYTKVAASLAALPASIFGELKKTGHVLADHLYIRQAEQDVDYYATACGPEPFAPGRDQEWFLKTKTNWYKMGHQPEDQKPVGEEILGYTKAVLYDALPALDTAGEDVISALGVLLGDKGAIDAFTTRHRIVGKGTVDDPEVGGGMDVGKMQVALAALLKGSLQSAVDQGFGLKKNYV